MATTSTASPGPEGIADRLSDAQGRRVERLADAPAGGLQWGHAAAENAKLRALGLVDCIAAPASGRNYAVLTELGRAVAVVRARRGAR